MVLPEALSSSLGDVVEGEIGEEVVEEVVEEVEDDDDGEISTVA